jgi:hypothetical protein
MKIKQGKETSNKHVSGFFMPNEECNPYNVSEHNASGESKDKEYNPYNVSEQNASGESRNRKETEQPLTTRVLYYHSIINLKSICPLPKTVCYP